MVVLTQEELEQILKKVLQDELNLINPNKDKINEEETLLRIEDIEAIFKVSKVTIHKWMNLGVIPYHKMNRKLYFKKSEVYSSLRSINQLKN